MFQFIYNLLSTVFYSVWSIVLCFITGKMPKVSAYYFENKSHGNNFFDICSQMFIKTDLLNMVNEECKKEIIKTWLSNTKTKDVINSELVRTKLINSL